jgi:hypothetical protein
MVEDSEAVERSVAPESRAELLEGEEEGSNAGSTTISAVSGAGGLDMVAGCEACEAMYDTQSRCGIEVAQDEVAEGLRS